MLRNKFQKKTTDFIRTEQGVKTACFIRKSKILFFSKKEEVKINHFMRKRSKINNFIRRRK